MDSAKTAEEARLAKEMTDAREEWERASKEMIAAMALFRDLHGNTDGIFKLRTASQNEASAITRYRKAVEAYAKAIISDRYPPQ